MTMDTQLESRGVDTALATLEGEAAAQRVKHEDEHLKEVAPEPWTRVPNIASTGTTYYDRPLLKSPVWTIDIPLYYFVGGAAGAAMTLGAAMQLASRAGRRDLQRASEICHWTGIIGSTAGAAFLIHDLGRPSRFLYMMRVFRPTSPMNMGVWVLAGAAPSAIATGLLLNRPGVLGRIGGACGYISGMFGAALAGYTGVLVANTAVPVWQDSRRWLPVLFLASSAASAAAIVDVFTDDQPSGRVTRIFGTAGRIAELAAAKKVESGTSTRPLRTGATGALWMASTALTVASVVVSLWPGKSRSRRKASGILAAAGSLCLRFAVHYAGRASARDPRAVFDSQRSAAASRQPAG
jgi:formate-dependent nitrite reductase membrane component NrfD